MVGVIWRVCQGAIGALIVWGVLRWALGPARARLHRRPPAVGDPELATVLDRTAARGAGRLALVTIDLSDETTPVRQAFLDADGDTAFEIGSVTKGLTGFLVADAVERGELALEAPVRDALPQLRGVPVGEVTLLQLCTHTSGLPRLGVSARIGLGSWLSGLLGTDPYRGTGSAAVLRTARRARPRPGSRYSYSNLGASVAGAAVAAVAGTTYPVVLKERVLDPLGMTRTSAAYDVPVRRGRSRGWVVANWRLDGYAPAGAVVSTSADLTRLCRAMLDRSVPGAAAMDPLLVPDPQEQLRRQGLFWINDAVPGSERTAVWHNGQTGGHSAFLAVYPQARRAVVVLSSIADSAGTGRVADAAVTRMIEGF